MTRRRRVRTVLLRSHRVYASYHKALAVVVDFNHIVAAEVMLGHLMGNNRWNKPSHKLGLFI